MSSKRQRAISILGMHRSGTSPITRAINLLGAYIGRQDQLMPPKEGNNPDGFWEHMEIFSFHERLLKTLSRTWDSTSPMPRDWWTREGIEPYRKELKDFIKREFRGQSAWLWKDPRSSLLLPLWQEVLRRLGIDVSYVLCLRNPLDVAESLKRRDGLSKNRSFNLWLLHTASACYWTNGAKRIVICYDHLLADWEESLRKVSTALDLPWPQDDRELKKALSDFVKLDSRHSYSDLESLNDKTAPEHVVSFYRLLLDCEKDQNLLGSGEFKEYTSKLFDSYQPRTYPPPSISAPKVSVVIPSYNHGKYIAETIESVLSQTYQDFEIVITDDGSVDDTVQEIQKFKDPRIRLFRFEENQGQFVAMWKCIEEAKGEYVAVLNSDDAFLPDKLEKQVQFLDAHPEVAAVFTYASLIDDDGNEFTDKSHFYYNIFKQPNRTRHEWLSHFFYNGNCLCHPSVLIRSECHKTMGHYEQRFGLFADLDFWVKVCLKKEIYIIQENLTKFRVLKGERSTGGIKRENRLRDAYEFSKILSHYLTISTWDEFATIFKETQPPYNKMDDNLIPFAIAMKALRVHNSPSHQIFGLNTLFGLFQDSMIAKKITDQFGFSYVDFIKLTGEVDIFNIYEKDTTVLKQIVEEKERRYQEDISALQNIIKEKDALYKRDTAVLEGIIQDRGYQLRQRELEINILKNTIEEKEALYQQDTKVLEQVITEKDVLKDVLYEKDTATLRQVMEEKEGRYQEDILTLQSVIKQREKRLVELETSLDNLKALVEEKDALYEKDTATLQQVINEKQCLYEQDTGVLKGLIEDREYQLHQRGLQINGLKKTIEEKDVLYKKDTAVLKHVIDEKEGRYQEDILTLQSVIKQREKRLVELETSLNNLKALVEEKDALYEKDTGILQQVIDEKQRLYGQDTAVLKGLIESMEYQLHQRGLQINGLKKTIEEKNALYEKDTAVLKHVIDEKEGRYQKDLSALQSMIKEREKQIESLESMIRILQQEIRERDERISRLILEVESIKENLGFRITQYVKTLFRVSP